MELNRRKEDCKLSICSESEFVIIINQSKFGKTDAYLVQLFFT